MVEIDREKTEGEGVFGSRIAGLEPEIVVDLISFTLESTRQLAEALRGKVSHFLHGGTVWVKGYVVEAPTREDSPSEPFGDYGVNKRAVEDYLLTEARRGNLPATMINPGHIVGPGYTAINPVGNHNPDVFGRLARGE